MERAHEPSRQPRSRCLKSHSTSTQQISDACQGRDERRQQQRKVQPMKTVSAGEDAEDCQEEVPQGHRMFLHGKPLHRMRQDRQNPLCLSQENFADDRGLCCGTVARWHPMAPDGTRWSRAIDSLSVGASCQQGVRPQTRRAMKCLRWGSAITTGLESASSPAVGGRGVSFPKRSAWRSLATVRASSCGRFRRGAGGRRGRGSGLPFRSR